MSPKVVRIDAQRNRERVLRAALRLGDQAGPVTMQDIADEAEVALTTVYRGFGSRLQLFSEAFAVSMCDELAETVAALQGEDPIASLYELALAQVRVAMGHRERLAQTPGWIEAFIAEFIRRYGSTVEATMVAAQASGALRGDLTQQDIGGVTRLFLGGLAQTGQPMDQARRYIQIWFQAVAPGWVGSHADPSAGPRG